MFINGSFGVYKHLNDSNNSNSNSQSIDKENKNEKIMSIDFTLYDQNGKEHKLSDYKGKTVFLNFWATWCPPCKEEMPYIEQLYKEYNKNNKDVVILGVASPNLDREGSKEDIIEFLQQEKYTFPVVMDNNGELAYQYGISAYPTTFIIDKEGYITQYVPGAMDKQTMKYLIENHN
ncbi:MAG: TlpA family protein disulfide reductase [Paraclostridium sp.]